MKENGCHAHAIDKQDFSMPGWIGHDIGGEIAYNLTSAKYGYRSQVLQINKISEELYMKKVVLLVVAVSYPVQF
jgi:hypothetical protein